MLLSEITSPRMAKENMEPPEFLAYFPYFEEKIKYRLMQLPCCLCIPLNIIGAHEINIIKCDMHIVTAGHISTACFINSFHQFVCLCIPLPLLG
jgi:hypothetical protein